MKRIINAIKAALWAVAETLHRVHLLYMERAGLILYVAHTATATFTDTTYAISASLPATYDAAGYGVTTITYTLIGRVQDFTPYGSKRETGTFKPIAGAVEKYKGAPNYGDGDLVCADVPADAGQVILKAAEASPNHYSMKITYSDGEVHYLDVLVSSWVLAGGKENTPLTRTATLGICKAPVVVVAP